MRNSNVTDGGLVQILQAIADLDDRLTRLESAFAQMRAPAPRVEPLPRLSPPPVSTPSVTRVPAQIERSIPITPAPALPPVRSVQEPRDLEATIGLNWTGWIGAIVLVLGVLFFLKYAWDQGWIHPTPTMRVIASIVTGMAISAVGERMHLRRVRILAATLHGAGLAIVLASFFGAYALFDPSERVLSIGGAFSGVVVAAGLGVVLSLHIDSIVLAMIALVGAYLAPFVLSTGEDHSAAFLGYLGALAAIGWLLSYFKPRWVPLRTLAWIGTFISYAAWWAGMGERNQHVTLATLWVAAFYGGFLIEMILTLRKSDAVINEIRITTSTAVICLLNTAATFGMMRFIYELPSDNQFLGFVAIGLALVQGAAVIATPSRSFSISSLLQSAGLVTLAVPLIFDQFAITLAWLALAVALAALAWELNLPAARGWAIVLLMLSIVRLFVFDGRLRSVHALEIGTFTVSRWMLMAWGMAVLAHLIAWLRPGKPGRFPLVEQRFAQIIPFPTFGRLVNSVVLEYATPIAAPPVTSADRVGIFVSIIGTSLFIGSAATYYTDSVLTYLSLLWLVPIVALAGQARGLGYLHHATVLAALATMKWFIVDELQPTSAHWYQPTSIAPFVNLAALNGLLLCGLVYGLVVQYRRAIGDGEVYLCLVWLGLVGLAILNFEACHAVDLLALSRGDLPDPGIVKHVVMSILWGLTGFTAVIAGFRRDIAPLRYAALVLLGVTLIKIFIVDMAEVKAVWRILSFIAVGGLLLGVSYLYHRQFERKRMVT